MALADCAPVMSKQQDRYDEADRARLVVEPRKSAGLPGTNAEHRTDFARDRARVLHLTLRFGARPTRRRWWGRATVTIRVPGRPIRLRSPRSGGDGRRARLRPPTWWIWRGGARHRASPYGHNGERALDQFAADFGGFEGNAQNFRIPAAGAESA